MGIAKTILTVVYFIIAIAMIILALIQTKEGNQKRWTIILAIIFAILSIALGILYMA